MLLQGTFWLVTTVMMAVSQGKLLPAIKRTAPSAEARHQAFALHYLLVFVWLAPAVFVPDSLLYALTIRLALFDVVLNVTSGPAAFSVGQTALTDKAINWLAGQLHLEPSRFSALSRLLVLTGVVLWYLL
ncbi:hypothetical protein [Hymenobacter terrenus]|uniref:hypothetical protein n=1 Tax=Hymenobacter terrenus TaxID=1629124 RepID=UPI000619DB91|nr:hypothetical protein [Hymenobacter terrenus]